jgi:hypothetical protein
MNKKKVYKLFTITLLSLGLVFNQSINVFADTTRIDENKFNIRANSKESDAYKKNTDNENIKVINLDDTETEKEYNLFSEQMVRLVKLPYNTENIYSCTVYYVMSLGDKTTRKLYDIPDNTQFKKTINIYKTILQCKGELYNHIYKLDESNTFGNAELVAQEEVTFTKEKPYYIKKIEFTIPKNNELLALSIIDSNKAADDKLINTDFIIASGISENGIAFAQYNYVYVNEKEASYSCIPWDLVDNDEIIKEEVIYDKALNYLDETFAKENPEIYEDYIGRRISFYGIEGEWVYYSIFDSIDNGIYRIKTDLTENTKLYHGDGSIDFMEGDWIYYGMSEREPSDMTKFAHYKMKKDGTSKQCVLPEHVLQFQLQDDWIYYILRRDNDSIYKMKLDGTKKTKLSIDKTMDMIVRDDYIYYINQICNDSIFRMKIDGTEKNKLTNISCNGMAIKDEWIYFADKKCDNYYKMRLDGRNFQRLVGRVETFEKDKAINVKDDKENTIKNKDLKAKADNAYKNSYMNTDSNIMNRGFAAEDSENIYYIKRNPDTFEAAITKFNKSSKSEKSLIKGYNFDGLNAVGDWIYYIGDNGIEKVKTDGTSHKTLCSEINLPDDISSFLKVQGDWIYYLSSFDSNSKLYRIKTDGTENALICSYCCFDMNVKGKWIYYVNQNDGDSIYRASIDGSTNEKIFSGTRCASIRVDGDWIYYSNLNDNGYLYKVKLDGTNNKKLLNKEVNLINIHDDWIYISDCETGIFKVEKDGKNLKKVSNMKTSSIVIIDNYLYAVDEQDIEIIRIQLN